MTNPISKNIKNARLNNNMTQEELANKIFTTRQTISNYETGKSKPDYETIGQIASALGVSAESLLYNDSDKRKKLKLWIALIIIAFAFLLSFSILRSSFLFGNNFTVNHLTYTHAYKMIIIPAVLVVSGFILLRLFELYIIKNKLYVNKAKTITIILFIFFILWFAAAVIDLPTIHYAASDNIKNEFGGPAALSRYIGSFYYKVICTPLFQLPILYSIFAFLGGLLAVCFNKKED